MEFDNRYQNFRLACAALLGVVMLAGCDSAAPNNHAADALAIEDALAFRDRSDADKKDDALRKPGPVLKFVQVEPGDRVFEMEAGAGYYTELLSHIVGLQGAVIMHNPPPFDSFVNGDVKARLADNRLANVRYAVSNFDTLDADDSSIDVVTWFLGPHELYYRPPGVETFGDVQATYAEVFRILKPGGTFVILDHAAMRGAPETSGNDLHRIDPAIVMGLAVDAGFEFVGESDILRNPDDQFDVGVFDPAVRRRTDQFLLKYRKPN